MSREMLVTLLEEIIEKVWEEQGMPKELTEDLIVHYAEKLWEGITNGYGSDLTTIDFDTPDAVMLQKLQESVWHFSAAKNYTQLKALSEALIGEDGHIREFSEFKIIARQINEEQKDQWLKAEYDLAIANGQMSRAWVSIQENKEILPNLEYSAVMDGHTTKTCITLDGVIRPVDDDFWKTWYPPNHWNCRSDVLSQGEDSGITPLDEIRYPEHTPEMFKINMAAKGMAFPEGHPYYNDNPDGVKATADKLKRKYGK